jgi:uncharacterized protein DUF4062
MDPANERRYQVFVSSTFVDLQEERRKALDAILETQSEEQFEFIKREIESSDYYIVIVARRYGSLAFAVDFTAPLPPLLEGDAPVWGTEVSFTWDKTQDSRTAPM